MPFCHVIAETVLSCLGAFASRARQRHLLAVFFAFVSVKSVRCFADMFTGANITFEDMSINRALACRHRCSFDVRKLTVSCLAVPGSNLVDLRPAEAIFYVGCQDSKQSAQASCHHSLPR